MNSQRVLIITGMHRSGTSLVSSLLQEAGVAIGHKLWPPGQANPRGYFEDVDFVNFHQKLLKVRQLDPLILEKFSFEPTSIETEEAKHLVLHRSHYPLWGWKDPRTSLFLPFWHELLPQARYLFVFRHPLEVVLSLIKRAHPAVIIDPLIGLRAWQIYNSSILRFYQQHSTRCSLVNIRTITANIPKFIELTMHKLGVSLQTPNLETIYQQAELEQINWDPEVNRLVSYLVPEIAQLYDNLEALADWSEKPLNPPTPVRYPELDQFNQFLFAASASKSNNLTGSLLLVLFNLIAPDTLKNGRLNWLDYLQGLEQAKAWLEEQNRAWQATAQQRADQIKEIQTWVAELEEGKAWLEEQNRAWQATAQQQADQIKEIQAWVTELGQGKAWLEQQWRNWQTTAQQQAEHINKLQARFREQEKDQKQSEH